MMARWYSTGKARSPRTTIVPDSRKTSSSSATTPGRATQSVRPSAVSYRSTGGSQPGAPAPQIWKNQRCSSSAPRSSSSASAHTHDRGSRYVMQVLWSQLAGRHSPQPDHLSNGGFDGKNNPVTELLVTAPPASSTALELKGNSQKRVDAAAIEHDDFFLEPRVFRVEADPVQVTAPRKKRRLARVHDAHDLEVRGRPRAVRVYPLDERRGNRVPVALRLVDVGMPQRRDSIAQHRARIGVDDRQRELALEVLRCSDAVAALLDEEVGPLLQPVVVDRVNVAGEKVLDGELKLNVHGLTSPCACGTAATVRAPRSR